MSASDWRRGSNHWRRCGRTGVASRARENLKTWCQRLAARVEPLAALWENRRRKPSVRPSLEGLEERFLPSVATATPSASNDPFAGSVTSQVTALEGFLQTTRQLVTQELSALSREVQALESEWLTFAAATNPFIGAWLHNSDNNLSASQGAGSGVGSGTMSTGHEASDTPSTGQTAATQGGGVVKMMPDSGSGSGSGSSSGSASVSGVIWYDSNGDGLMDDGEAGMSNVTVNLDNAQGLMLMTTSTNANGGYQFSVSQSILNQGSGSGSGSGFEIQVVMPVGDVATLENAVGSGINSNVNASGYSNVFSLAPGGSEQVNGGLVAPTATVSGEVWLDSNGDGLLDNGESGLSGVTVNLDNAQGMMLQSTSTNANGNYSFNVNLGSGSGSGGGYEIQVVIPTGDVATVENAYGSGINSNINASGYSNVFYLDPGGSQQVNAGVVAPTATVSGEVWLDSNSDGLLDNGESGISGVTVNLDNAQGMMLQSTITGANGNYSFNVNLGSGSSLSGGYEIQVIFPSGETATIENASGSGINSNINAAGYSNLISLSPGTSQQVNAGLVPQSGSGSGSATVSGEVWLDNNGDGILDDGEMGYSGATVNLDTYDPTTNTVALFDSTTTDSNGNYQFFVPYSDLPDDFEVQVVFPTGFEATSPGPASVIDPDGYSPAFALAAGGAVQKNGGMVSTVVNTTKDDPNGALGGNKVTLRDAIKTVINKGLDQPVTFTVNGTISLQDALPTFTKNITIIGPGSSNLTVQGNGNAGDPYCIFNNVDTAEIDNLTISGGYDNTGGGIYNAGNLTLRNDTISNNTATGKGGGIFNMAASTLTLDHDIIEDNKAQDGGGIYNYSDSTLQSFAGNIASAIVNNTATADGGGIYNKGKVNLQAGDSIGLNKANMTSGKGGGVYNASLGTFLIKSGIIANNGAFQGGGLYNNNDATLPSDNFQGNSANQGGGLYLTTGSDTDFGDGPNTTTVSGNNLVGAGAKGKGILYEKDATFFGALTDDDDPGGLGVPK
jgi:hypothetical protein